MRTNIVIDKELMAEAQKLAGTRTMKETVDLALRELVDRHKRLGILDLPGKYKWEGDLNEMRRNFFRNFD
jgi:Arc/MetJ family transcription regulator